MRTRTKVILTCILGALFVAGLLLLILTSGDILDTYRWWLRVKDLETYNYTAYQFRNYIFYFIGMIVFLCFLAISIIFIWAYNKMRYSYEVYLRERPKRQAQRTAQKEQKLKEKINKLNGSK